MNNYNFGSINFNENKTSCIIKLNINKKQKKYQISDKYTIDSIIGYLNKHNIMTQDIIELDSAEKLIIFKRICEKLNLNSKPTPKINRTNKYLGRIAASTALITLLTLGYKSQSNEEEVRYRTITLTPRPTHSAYSPTPDPNYNNIYNESEEGIIIEPPLGEQEEWTTDNIEDTITIKNITSEQNIDKNDDSITEETTNEITDDNITYSYSYNQANEEETYTDYDNVVSVYLDFSDKSNTDKATTTKETYYSIIEKYSEKYGLDPNLVLCIATQERGIHSSSIDQGGGIGLMQIQYRVWINEEITYYELNKSTGEYEKQTIKITDDMLRNLDTNIKTGCIILQNCLIDSNYNIPVAIQMYNMGIGTMRNILRSYGSSLSKISPDDLGWLKYRRGHKGDPSYLENVNSWAEISNYTVVNVKTGEQVSIEFTNENRKTNTTTHSR